VTTELPHGKIARWWKSRGYAQPLFFSEGECIRAAIEFAADLASVTGAVHEPSGRTARAFAGPTG